MPDPHAVRRLLLATIACLLVVGGASAKPLYPNSVVSNDLEFIRAGDIGAFRCLIFTGTTRAEMPGAGEDLFADGVRVFSARFADGTQVPLWVHPRVGGRQTSEGYAEKVARALGELPSFMRAKLDHVVINPGDKTAFGEDAGHFFVLTAGNIDARIGTGDLPHTVFHESVHATLDQKWKDDRLWKKAQRSDADFVTDYAARRPGKEDLAESAIFAWTMTMHPGRLPAGVEAAVRRTIPARLAFLRTLFTSQPSLTATGQESCD